MKQTHKEMIDRLSKRVKNGKVVVLTSGGADSGATVKKLNDNGYEVHGLFINYGQPNFSAEEWCVRKWSLASLKILELSGDLCFMLGMKKDAKEDEDAFIPFRNTLFMILAAMHANYIDADGISIGLMKEDEGVFPDSNWVHHSLVRDLITYSGARKYQVLLPLKDYTKKEILELCSKGNIESVSCWLATLEEAENGNVIKVCGECAQCRERGSS
jgi:7-cyano-7-deazaguanine synthase in queuosine biosynthesis